MAEMTAADIMAHAATLTRAKNGPHLINFADQIIAAIPNDPVGWCYKVAGLLLSKRFDDAFALIQSREQNGFPPEIFAERSARFLLDNGANATLIETAAHSNTAYTHAIWLYFAGCAQQIEGDTVAALDLFARFRQQIGTLAAQGNARLFIEDASLNLILRQGRLVATAGEVERRLAQFRESPIRPDLQILSDPPEDGDLYMTSCDVTYFKTFGAEFVGHFFSRLPDAALYIHVTNCREDLEALKAMISPDHVDRIGIGVTEDPPYTRTSYFTVERFFVAEMILNRYDRPIVTLDFDITPSDKAPDFHAFAEGTDLCLFETGRNEPASICWAAVMAFAATETAKEFLRTAQAVCMAGDLENPDAVTWMIDQAALFSVRNYFAQMHPGTLRFRDYRESGLTLDDALITFVTEERKLKLRRANSVTEGSVVVQL